MSLTIFLSLSPWNIRIVLDWCRLSNCTIGLFLRRFHSIWMLHQWRKIMEVHPSMPLQAQNTDALLALIVDELRSIGLTLARQDERIEALRKTSSPSHLPDWESGSVEGSDSLQLTAVTSSTYTTSISSSLSIELRTGFILQEALNRYNLNAIPAWSPHYGTPLMRGEGPETAEDAIRNIEWSSVVGECWKMPHDNRLNFCFRADMSDSDSVLRVRNFVSHFHRPAPDAPKGEYFNVWDWFDTGISAYWYPGKETSTIPLGFPDWLAECNSKAKISFPLSTMIAPWRRIINMQGLTSLSVCNGSTNFEELSEHDLCPFLSETKMSVFQEPMDEVLWRAVKNHLSCVRVSETEHAAMETKGWILFHVTFYEILTYQEDELLKELWPCGELHSDRLHLGKPRRIRESAMTIIAIPCAELPGPKSRSIYWTMLCLRPHKTPHLSYSESRDDLSHQRTHEMIDEMSDLIQGSLLIVVGRWEQIACYLEHLLAEKHGLLNPEYHDSLLTDDALFTRSKKYFWAIEFLIEAETSVLDVINQVKRFVELLNANPPSGEVARRMFAARLEKHNTAIQKLDSLRKGFAKKQEEAKALRDGLFSASAVMESRASTQQGENIKILTYVSIFFLPISVCTSFWSMSDSLFSLSSLAIVTPVVALATYAIVLNLDRISRLFIPLSSTSAKSKSAFQSFVDFQVRKMQQDRSSVWKERGNAFEKSKFVKSGGWRPSKWLILQYTCRCMALAAWRGSMALVAFGPHAVTKWGRDRRQDNDLRHAPLANLGDVRVQVQVDVNVEKSLSTAESSV